MKALREFLHIFFAKFKPGSRRDLGMFIYAVRVRTMQGRLTVSLVDWPEVSVAVKQDPLVELKAALLASIAKQARTRTPIPTPKAKPSSTFFVRLSAGEAMKVMVINEMFAGGLNPTSVASALGLEKTAISNAINLSQPTDVELLNKILNMAGKRLLAYTVAS